MRRPRGPVPSLPDGRAAGGSAPDAASPVCCRERTRRAPRDPRDPAAGPAGSRRGLGHLRGARTARRGSPAPSVSAPQWPRTLPVPPSGPRSVTPRCVARGGLTRGCRDRVRRAEPFGLRRSGNLVPLRPPEGSVPVPAPRVPAATSPSPPARLGSAPWVASGAPSRPRPRLSRLPARCRAQAVSLPCSWRPRSGRPRVPPDPHEPAAGAGGRRAGCSPGRCPRGGEREGDGPGLPASCPPPGGPAARCGPAPDPPPGARCLCPPRVPAPWAPRRPAPPPLPPAASLGPRERPPATREVPYVLFT